MSTIYVILHNDGGNINIRLSKSLNRAKEIAKEIMDTESRNYHEGGGDPSFSMTWQRIRDWKWTNDIYEHEYVLIEDKEVE